VGTAALIEARPAGEGVPSPRSNITTEDILVFERTPHGFKLVGGRGRGAGWAGVVELDDADDSVVLRAWRRSAPFRVAAELPVPICGPYYAPNAVAVTVGDRHVVVFGSRARIALSDTDVLRTAASVVDQFDGTPAEKLLADELEVVHALRALMEYRPETVHGTIRHVATVAANALSCEMAMIRVEHGGVSGTEVLDVASGRSLEPDAESVRYLEQAAQSRNVTVEQRAPPPPNPFPAELAARMTLPIGGDQPIGAMVLAHRLDAPRGFTSLCQRIGRTIAEAAELLVTQASAREQLSAERDALARLSGTDSLTGVANRRAWEQLQVQSLRGPAEAGYVVCADVDGLKTVNDCFGHATGDALLQAAAQLLRSSVRSIDFVARIGGDEFAILLRGADAGSARRVLSRIRRAEVALAPVARDVRVSLSLGSARVVDGDIESALNEADQRMYADKRTRGTTEPPAG
jgi:diguanylate cyclase (GGDEF)-like protein